MNLKAIPFLAIMILSLSFVHLTHPTGERAPRQAGEAIETCPAAGFFKDIVGTDEKTLRKELRWNEETGVLDSIKGLNKANYLIWKAAWVQQYPRCQAIFNGQVSFDTVSDLNDAITRKNARAEAAAQAQPLGQFNILLHDPKNPAATDVTALQADPRNKNAVFQVASTMYGPVEGRIANPKEYLGKMLDCPWHGPAQGERASISAAAATIYRKYFMPTENYMNHKRGIAVKGLDNDQNYYYLLSAVGDKAPRYDQKVNVTTVRRNQFTEKDIENIGIFAHANVDVTVKNSETPHELQSIPLAERQQITQIFNAAHDMEFSFWPWKNQNEIDFAKIVLRGMYQGTLKKAYLLDKKKVFLTLLGGGVFKNDMSWVAEVFEDEATQQLIKDGGLEVYLIYRPVTNLPVLKRLYAVSCKINKPDEDLQSCVDEQMEHVNSLLQSHDSFWSRLKKWFVPASAGAVASKIIYSRYKK